MTTIPNPPADTEAPVLPPAERKQRISALQSELELLDNVRDRVRNALRDLIDVREYTDRNPVRFRTINAVSAAAADCLTAQAASLTAEIRTLNQELTDLSRNVEPDYSEQYTIEEMVARGDALGIVQTVLGGGR